MSSYYYALAWEHRIQIPNDPIVTVISRSDKQYEVMEKGKEYAKENPGLKVSICKLMFEFQMTEVTETRYE